MEDRTLGKPADQRRRATGVLLALVALLATGAAPAFAAYAGWEETFDRAGFGGGKYSPTLAEGRAHYTLDHGYFANLQQEFAPVSLASHPWFGIRAQDLRGAIFVKFRIDGEWQKSWVIGDWHPEQLETRFVDLRRFGREVSGVWLNSRSSLDGAEWFLDWLGLVASDNPLGVQVATAGGLREGGQRAVSFNLRNGLGKDVRLMCTVEALPDGGEPLSRQPVALKAGQAANAGMSVPEAAGARYELRIDDRDTQAVYYQACLTVPPVLEARLASPSYRNAIYASRKLDRLVVACTLNILPPALRELSLRTTLLQGEKMLAETRTASRESGARVELPVPALAPGEYAVQVEVQHRGAALDCRRLPLRVYGPAPEEVCVGDDLGLRVNGEPFLPVGFYTVPRQYLEQVARAGYNAVLSYDSNTASLQPYLDEAQRVGLKVMVHSPGVWFGADGERKLREAVSTLRDKPALLGWYLYDEPSAATPGRTPADLARLYALMQELDPYHPTFTVYCQPGEFALYRDTHDVFMCDPYPVGNRPLDYVAEWTELGREAMAGRKPVVIVPQSFGSEQGPQTWWRMPTAEEETCMGYLALVHGAKGLFYYRFNVEQYDQKLADQKRWAWVTVGHLPELRPEAWAGFQKLGPQLRQLAPVILSAEPEAKLTVAPDKPRLHLALRDYQGKRYLLAVNPSEEAVAATITVEGLRSAGAEVLFEQREVAVKGGALADRFERFAVHVYRFR